MRVQGSPAGSDLIQGRAHQGPSGRDPGTRAPWDGADSHSP